MSERDEEIRDLSRERLPPERSERAEFLSGQREGRADELERQRVDRADEVERARAERAQDLAVATALRDKEVDYRLVTHDQRFALINGSIERTGKQLVVLSEQVREMREERKLERAVSEALREEVQEANQEVRAARETQISGRMLLACTASVLVGIVGVIVTVLIATHALA